MGDLFRITCTKCKINKQIYYGSGFEGSADLYFCEQCKTFKTHFWQHKFGQVVYVQPFTAFQCPKDATHTVREIELFEYIGLEERQLFENLSCPRCQNGLLVITNEGLWD